MNTFNFKINGTQYDTEVLEINGKDAQIKVNGVVYNVEIDDTKFKSPVVSKPVARPVAAQPVASAAPVASAPQQSRGVAGPGNVQSPLPGTVLDLKVKEGDAVQAGQCLMILEAMKMENNIEAPCAGTVTKINKQKGDSVMEGDTLIVIG
ncbi:MAG: biotin/lipoyl-binding protein [Salinivirgaceae bacterium]|nr:biotin/lipoyl-binding protein [Salinivirgaceae bacterium]